MDSSCSGGVLGRTGEEEANVSSFLRPFGIMAARLIAVRSGLRLSFSTRGLDASRPAPGAAA